MTISLIFFHFFLFVFESEKKNSSFYFSFSIIYTKSNRTARHYVVNHTDAGRYRNSKNVVRKFTKTLYSCFLNKNTFLEFLITRTSKSISHDTEQLVRKSHKHETELFKMDDIQR